MQHLPVSVREVIFCCCDDESQKALAQTSQAFWRSYCVLKCIPQCNKFIPDPYLTPRQHWRETCTKQAAALLASQFRNDLVLKPNLSAAFPDHDSCYHASLVGHLSTNHLRFILQHPNLLCAGLDHYFGSYVVDRFTDRLLAISSHATDVIMLMLKVYHTMMIVSGRQASPILSWKSLEAYLGQYQSRPAAILLCITSLP